MEEPAAGVGAAAGGTIAAGGVGAAVVRTGAAALVAGAAVVVTAAEVGVDEGRLVVGVCPFGAAAPTVPVWPAVPVVAAVPVLPAAGVRSTVPLDRPVVVEPAGASTRAAVVVGGVPTAAEWEVAGCTASTRWVDTAAAWGAASAMVARTEVSPAAPATPAVNPLTRRRMVRYSSPREWCDILHLLFLDNMFMSKRPGEALQIDHFRRARTYAILISC